MKVPVKCQNWQTAGQAISRDHGRLTQTSGHDHPRSSADTPKWIPSNTMPAEPLPSHLSAQVSADIETRSMPEPAAMDDQYPAPPEASTAVVAMPDEIDIANAGKLGAALAAACRSGVSLLIADMTETTFCDASGVRMLVLAHKRAADRGIELRAAVPSPRVRRVLVLLGLDSIVPIHPTVDAARGASQRPTRTTRR